MSCIAFLLWQTPVSFKCLPANTNQLSKANFFLSSFCLFLFAVFVFLFCFVLFFFFF